MAMMKLETVPNLTYPDGRVVNYGYNAVNRLASVATTGMEAPIMDMMRRDVF